MPTHSRSAKMTPEQLQALAGLVPSDEVGGKLYTTFVVSVPGAGWDQRFYVWDAGARAWKRIPKEEHPFLKDYSPWGEDTSDDDDG